MQHTEHLKVLVLPPINQITDESLDDIGKPQKIYYGGETTFADVKERLVKYMNKAFGQRVPDDLHLWKPEFKYTIRKSLYASILKAKADLQIGLTSESRIFPGTRIDEYARELVATYQLKSKNSFHKKMDYIVVEVCSEMDKEGPNLRQFVFTYDHCDA